jgi:uncharacterized protein YPO0396
VAWDREGFFRNAPCEAAPRNLVERVASVSVHGRKKHYSSRIESDHRKRFRVRSYHISTSTNIKKLICAEVKLSASVKRSCMITVKFLIRLLVLL